MASRTLTLSKEGDDTNRVVGIHIVNKAIHIHNKPATPTTNNRKVAMEEGHRNKRATTTNTGEGKAQVPQLMVRKLGADSYSSSTLTFHRRR